ncbi:MAG: Dabb family protein [Actinomycetota bacterium]
MIRHHVLITLNDETPDWPTKTDLADQIVAELEAYAPTCATVRDYKVGRDLDLADGTADVAVVAEFDDVEGYRFYSQDAGHVEIIQRLIAPNAASLVRAQTEF